MPREGRALLSQVEGLLEQYLELGYDEGKDKVQSLLSEVRSTMGELGDPESEGGEGDEAPEGPKPRTAFRAASKRAKRDMDKARSEEESKAESEEDEVQTGDDERRRKSKAY